MLRLALMLRYWLVFISDLLVVFSYSANRFYVAAFFALQREDFAIGHFSANRRKIIIRDDSPFVLAKSSYKQIP